MSPPSRSRLGPSTAATGRKPGKSSDSPPCGEGRAPLTQGQTGEAQMAGAAASDYVIDAKRDRLVIFASTLGTVFEWYDFFIYGTLAAVIGKQFFPSSSETAQFLLALASFGVGFGVRPIGAALFGYLGDRLGRKYTFLVTITLMGLATAAVGLLPTFATLGVAAPALLVFCRLLQGLALGGE